MAIVSFAEGDRQERCVVVPPVSGTPGWAHAPQDEAALPAQHVHLSHAPHGAALVAVGLAGK